MSDAVTLTVEQAERLSLAVLEGNGFSHDHAAAIMRSVVAAQTDECRTGNHGSGACDHTGQCP